MSDAGLSKARLGRMHDVMAGYVQRGEGPFRIASMTKPITAVAALILLEECTRRDDASGPLGAFGWDGGLGTSWRSDPREDMVGILLTQAAWTSPSPPEVCLDFWTSAYQAIDD